MCKSAVSGMSAREMERGAPQTMLWRRATAKAMRVREEEQIDAEDPGSMKGSVFLSIHAFSSCRPCLSSSGPTSLWIIS